jgi:hypothetical protein
LLRSEAVKELITLSGNPHLAPYYNLGMEVQVNCAKDGGETVKGIWNGKRWKGWTDGLETWKSFRIPLNADSDPFYEDRPMTFSSSHIEGIGMTGWDWKHRHSVYLAFDFDSIMGHEKAGLPLEELNRVQDVIKSLPYTTLLKSTSGNGLHLYVFLSIPVPTSTHTEHAALARSVLTHISAECGYNLNNAVDVCGGVMWVYHRKQIGTDGFQLLKKGVPFPSEAIPTNWREHIVVTSKKAKKIRKVKGTETNFEDLLSAVQRPALDSDHQKLLKWFCDNDATLTTDWWWDSDNNMLVCHTKALAEAHKDLGFKGFFYTNSSGSSDKNCFCFPSHAGSWVVRRFSIGCKEHQSWVSDQSGWSKFTYNALPDYEVCARAFGGLENIKGEYVFAEASFAIEVLRNIGCKVDLLPAYIHRQAYLKQKGDDKIILSLDRLGTELNPDGFLASKVRWERVLSVPVNSSRREVQAPDSLIRHVIANGAEAGWYIKINEEWICHPKSNVATVLSAVNVGKADLDQMMGKTILSPWRLVNIPFEAEYPGNRQWNHNAAALICDPEEGSCETWMKVLQHIGSGLDPYVQQDTWCQENAMETGLDYLLCWIGNLFQRPEEPLPYLFLVGGQNTGKSTMHEALSTLFRNGRGYSRADNALLSQSNFNAELENAILCVVEETNLSRNKEAANRVKDWVTGKTIAIRAMHKNSYDITNTTHWIQCANDMSYCPILPGDTRIVIISVNPLKGEVPKRVLFERLNEEKAAFLHKVMNLELPEPNGRLAIPCLNTAEKEAMNDYAKSELTRFLEDKVTVSFGRYITFEDFVKEFTKWLPLSSRQYWTSMRVSREFPKSPPYCKGKYKDEIVCLGNITFNPEETHTEYKLSLDMRNGRLVRGDINE